MKLAAKIVWSDHGKAEVCALSSEKIYSLFLDPWSCPNYWVKKHTSFGSSDQIISCKPFGWLPQSNCSLPACLWENSLGEARAACCCSPDKRVQTRMMTLLLEQVIIFHSTFIFPSFFFFLIKSITCIYVKLEYRNEHSLTNWRMHIAFCNSDSECMHSNAWPWPMMQMKYAQV